MRILVFGDSNSWGYDAASYDPQTGIAKRMSAGVRWPSILQRNLGQDATVIENCLNGRTLMQDDPYFPNHQGLKSLQEALDANAPLDLVILALGCNELKHMFHLSAGMIAFGLERLVAESMASPYGYPPPKLLIVAPHPTSPDIGQMIFGFSFGPLAYEKSLALPELYRQIAKKYGCAFVSCADKDFELNPVDGLHYSPQDHAQVAHLVTAEVQRLFKLHSHA